MSFSADDIAEEVLDQLALVTSGGGASDQVGDQSQGVGTGFGGGPVELDNQVGRAPGIIGLGDLKGLGGAFLAGCDECIAVYGKFLNAYSLRRDVTCEMFIDITPGTPPIYREEVLTKLFTVGYSIEDNIIYGTDCNTARYNRDWVREWTGRDNAIYNKLGLGSNVLDKIYNKNLMRFLGLIDANVDKKTLKPGEN